MPSYSIIWDGACVFRILACVYLIAINNCAPVKEIGRAQVRRPVDVLVPYCNHHVGDDATFLAMHQL
jgi:hypothetical protein